MESERERERHLAKTNIWRSWKREKKTWIERKVANKEKEIGLNANKDVKQESKEEKRINTKTGRCWGIKWVGIYWSMERKEKNTGNEAKKTLIQKKK